MSPLGLTLGLAPQQRSTSTPPTPPRTTPYTLATYGDSFGQRAMDITGAPNTVDTAVVNPVTFRWPNDATTPVGGVSWGPAAWIGALSRGKYRTTYDLNRSVGGSNTGQLIDDAGGTTQRLSVIKDRITAARAAGVAVDGVILHAGTNDGVTTFNDNQSYTNIRTICTALVGLGNLVVVLHTVLPRGHAAATGSRLAADRITWCNAFNARLLADLEAEPALVGKVKVVDPRALFADPDGGAQANDTNPALVYDGLHLNPVGCKLLAEAMLAGFDALLTGTVANHLTTGSDYLGADGLMTGTNGAVSVVGNAASNTGFTLNTRNSVGPFTDAAIPQGWTVATTTGWNGTSPNNVTGTVTASKVAAGVGEAIRLVVACNPSGKTNDNTVSLEARHAVTLPDTTALPENDYFEALVRVEITNPVGFRGADLELRIGEPDGTTRTVRAFGVAPNGTAGRRWTDGQNYIGANALILRTPERIRKAGTYGTITLAVMLHFAAGSGVTSAAGTFDISQVTFRKC